MTNNSGAHIQPSLNAIAEDVARNAGVSVTTVTVKQNPDGTLTVYIGMAEKTGTLEEVLAWAAELRQPPEPLDDTPSLGF
jgi:ribosome maturation factor RimP